MSDPNVRLQLVPKDPEMRNVLKTVEKVKGCKIVDACVSWSDDLGRMEEIRFMMDNGKEFRIISTSLCWYEDQTLMRILPGITKGHEEYEATNKAMPCSGLVAFMETLSVEEWKDIVGDRNWPGVLKAFNAAKKARKNRKN
jgi:hypothetical protein